MNDQNYYSGTEIVPLNDAIRRDQLEAKLTYKTNDMIMS